MDIQAKAMQRPAFNFLITSELPTIKLCDNEKVQRNDLFLVCEVDEFNFRTGRAAVIRALEVMEFERLPGIIEKTMEAEILELTTIEE